MTGELEERSDPVFLEACKGNGKKILVIDDMDEQLQIASSTLEKLGYTAVCVNIGEESVLYFLKDNDADLLILGMIMAHGIDGFETYR